MILALILGAALHVSPTGDDANPGTVDKPLRTFAVAQRAKGAEVLFHTGTYYLPETIVFTAADSGRTFAAAAGATETFSVDLSGIRARFFDGVSFKVVSTTMAGGFAAVNLYYGEP